MPCRRAVAVQYWCCREAECAAARTAHRTRCKGLLELAGVVLARAQACGAVLVLMHMARYIGLLRQVAEGTSPDAIPQTREGFGQLVCLCFPPHA